MHVTFLGTGSAMATAERAQTGILLQEGDDALLGARIVGPEASELVAELAVAIRQRATLHDLAGTIHVHPTLSEAVMEAAEQALGQAIHTTN